MFALSPFAFPSISVPTGGADFSNLTYQTLNINEGWTLLTKSGRSFNAPTYDADGIGSYTINGGLATFPVMPVAFRQAYAVNADGDNVLLTTSDDFRLDIRMSGFQDTSGVENILKHTIGFSVCNDPTATNGATFGACGLNVVKNLSTSYKVETTTAYAASTYGTTSVRSHAGSVWVRDGKVIAVTGVGLDGSGGFDAAANRFANTSTSGYTLTTGPVYLAFWLLPFGISGTYSQEVSKMKVEFRVIQYGDITP